MDVNLLCAPDCPLECEAISYNSFMSHTDYPSKIYSSLLANNSEIIERYQRSLIDMHLPVTSTNITYEFLKSHMLELSVFYGELGYEKYEEFAKMDAVDLISDIGGTLGLFLGMSFLSFVEIIDIIIRIFFHKRYEQPSSSTRREEIYSVKL